MDFNDTPEEARFRAQVRAWLDAHAKRKSDMPADDQELPEAEALKRARAWQAVKAADGYAAITWPKEYGGLGGTAIQAVIYDQEEAHYAVPNTGFFAIGLGMCMPTLMTFATPQQLQRYVRPALYGEEIWCQLFSEPSGGSDLAAARTRAVRDGDDWIVNGQKVWTTGAQHSDFGIIVTRSDPTKPKHAGLTFFFFDMRSPGVEVRPIRQITGGTEFNEVFFKDVRIPDTQRLGTIGGGWKVAITTLMFERILSGERITGAPDAIEVLQLARHTELCGRPAIEDGRVRERIANWWLNARGLELTTFRALTELSRGQTPGPGFAIGKLISAPQLQEVSQLMMDLMGADGMVLPNYPLHSMDLQYMWLLSSGLRIAAGTDEIMKNILAERVLGMPADVRIDKNVPFNELPG